MECAVATVLQHTACRVQNQLQHLRMRSNVLFEQSKRRPFVVPACMFCFLSLRHVTTRQSSCGLTRPRNIYIVKLESGRGAEVTLIRGSNARRPGGANDNADIKHAVLWHVQALILAQSKTQNSLTQEPVVTIFRP